jgi:glycosyltransferase involved in cell wall biosynthesis
MRCAVSPYAVEGKIAKETVICRPVRRAWRSYFAQVNRRLELGRSWRGAAILVWAIDPRFGSQIMNVSLAMIFKDAESSLEVCLESVAGHVDEIVIVDTGSSDRTREIAARYTDRILDFVWRKDFSAARQFAFDQATGDWIFWLDADDTVTGAEAIRPMLSALPPNIGVVYWRYVYGRDVHGNPLMEFWRERCVRRGVARWEGRVHEILVSDVESHYSDEVVVEHHQDPGVNRIPRNIELLEAERRDKGDTPRVLYYLGQDYMYAGRFGDAIAALRRYVRVATWEDEKYLAQARIAELLRRLERYEAAIDADLAALKIHPRWPNAYFGLVKSYFFLEDWQRVVDWAEIGRTMPEPETIAIVDPMEYRFNWIIYYTNALNRLGRVAEALEWTRRALQIVPDAQWHSANAEIFARELGLDL